MRSFIYAPRSTLMSRYIEKVIYLEKPKGTVFWNERSNTQELDYKHGFYNYSNQGSNTQELGYKHGFNNYLIAFFCKSCSNWMLTYTHAHTHLYEYVYITLLLWASLRDWAGWSWDWQTHHRRLAIKRYVAYQ